MLGGFYSQQQFLRNLDLRSNMLPVDQPSVMDEAYKEFIMQLSAYDTRRDFWLQTDYYKQRQVGNSKVDAALLDEVIDNIQFTAGDATRNTSDSVKLIAETAADANNLLRQYVAFASQRAASHLNEELTGAWAARTVQMKAQVKRQEAVAKAIFDRKVHSVEQALKIAQLSFAAMGIILYFDGQLSLAMWCFAMIAAILPYILLNLGILGRRYKVFMGDAGSTLIGFTVIWILLETTQGQTHPISPVTALWIIAIPLMDMIAIMYRRLRKGMSPFSPDRQHIHHLIMRAGFTSRQAFVLITAAAALLASIGVAAEYIHSIPEWVMLALFLLAFVLYDYCIKRAWKVARFIRRHKRRQRRNSSSIS